METQQELINKLKEIGFEEDGVKKEPRVRVEWVNSKDDGIVIGYYAGYVVVNEKGKKQYIALVFDENRGVVFLFRGWGFIKSTKKYVGKVIKVRKKGYYNSDVEFLEKNTALIDKPKYNELVKRAVEGYFRKADSIELKLWVPIAGKSKRQGNNLKIRWFKGSEQGIFLFLSTFITERGTYLAFFREGEVFLLDKRRIPITGLDAILKAGYVVNIDLSRKDISLLEREEANFSEEIIQKGREAYIFLRDYYFKINKKK